MGFRYIPTLAYERQKTFDHMIDLGDVRSIVSNIFGPDSTLSTRLIQLIVGFTNYMKSGLSVHGLQEFLRVRDKTVLNLRTISTANLCTYSESMDTL
jgi:hypothetical protein